jgi:hypothetical protein
MSAALVKRFCNHCGEKIEFDSSRVTPELQFAECPHCFKQTFLGDQPIRGRSLAWGILPVVVAAIGSGFLVLVLCVAVFSFTNHASAIGKTLHSLHIANPTLSGKWYCANVGYGTISTMEFFGQSQMRFKDLYGLPLTCRYQIIDSDHLKIDFPSFQTGSTSIYRRGLVDVPATSEICQFSLGEDSLILIGETGYTRGTNEMKRGERPHRVRKADNP